MKKFDFRLSGFLRIKEFEEKNAWNEVLKQEGRVQSLRNRITTLEDTIQDNRNQLSNPQLGPASVAQWQWAEESIRGMKAQIEILEKEYALEARTLEKLVLRHREVKKEAKIITNYKERKRNEFYEERAKIEEIQRSEFATLAYLRKEKKQGSL